jgi:hypothetical protein
MKKELNLEVTERGTVKVLFAAELASDDAERFCRFVTGKADGSDTDTDRATAPAARRLPYNTSFGQSLYRKRRDAKETATFVVWAAFCVALLVAALFRWSPA